MSDIRFWTTEKINLPRLSYIFHKPELPGVDFNTLACSVTGESLFIDIQRGKEGIKNSNYHLELGAKEVCKKRIIEAKNGLYQMDIKEANKVFSLIFDLPQICPVKMRWMLVLT